MRASQRGNALFRARTQPLRQPRAPTSRHAAAPRQKRRITMQFMFSILYSVSSVDDIDLFQA